MSYKNPWLLPTSNYQSQSQSGIIATISLREWSFSFKRMTFWVSLLQFLILYISYGYSYFSMKQYDCILYELGAKFTPSIKFDYQYQRLVFPIMLHVDIFHFLGNLIPQILYGFILENIYGTRRVALLYWLSGINGNLLSCIYHKYNIGVGASGAIFGLMGTEIVLIIGHYREISIQRFFWFLFIVCESVFSLFRGSSGAVDGSAHLNGLITGILLGLMFENSLRSWFRRLQKISLILLIIQTCFLLFYINYSQIFNIAFVCQNE